MNRQQIVSLSHSQTKYLQSNKIRQLFSHLLRQLLLHQPQNPIQYLITYLDKNTRRLIICLQGYDNQQRNRLALIICNKLNFKFIDVSAMFQLQDYHLAHDDQINHKVLQALKNSETLYKGLLISGYPNNLPQVQFIKKSPYLPSRYFHLPHNSQKLKIQLSSQYTQTQISHLLSRHQMQHKQLSQSLGQFLDTLPISIDQASQRLTQAFNMKISKKNIPYDSPRIIVIHPPYLTPPSLSSLISTFILHHITLPKILSKSLKKQAFKNFVQKQIRKNHSLSKQIQLALIQTECKSSISKTKGFILSGWPSTKQNLVFLSQQFIKPHLIYIFDLPLDKCESQLKKLQQGNPQIFPGTSSSNTVKQKPKIQQYRKQYTIYHQMIQQLKLKYQVEILGWNQSIKQVLKNFQHLINNHKIYS